MVDLYFDQVNINTLTKKEWLVTNGIGGFASGTISGVLTRRYHGLLVAALKPPVERTTLVAKFDPWARHEGRTSPLFGNQWKTLMNPIEPANGMDRLKRFWLDGSIPTWEFHFGDSILQQQIWMEQGENTTYVRYAYLQGTGEISLTLKGMLSYCDFHETNRAGAGYQVDAVPLGARVVAGDEAHPYYLFSEKAEMRIHHNIWLPGFFLAEEEYRGQDALADYFNGVDLLVRLMPGEAATIVLSTEEAPDLDAEQAYRRQKAWDAALINESGLQSAPEEIRRLGLAADQFIVKRTVENVIGHSVIAGYPWFSDWGRDTMIALPGLTLATKRYEIAESILRTFGKFVDRGMLPNRFPDLGEVPEYNTIDAALWYFEAVYQYFCHISPEKPEQALKVVRDIFPVLEEIVAWHEKGTRFNIRVDPQDGLIYGGEKGIQLTWMDAKVGDLVVTPRIGKPVEINALWYSALRIMEVFAKALGESGDEYKWKADKVKASFAKFWIEEKSYCYDVIDGPEGDDPSIRPNQVIAGAVSFSPMGEDQIRQIIAICEKELVTPYGLRSLAPAEPEYKGRYGGNLFSRDTAYHQGTAWGWLIGPYLLAKIKYTGEHETVLRSLERYLENLNAHGLGTLSEIFDGDGLNTPRGCIAQAWSVAAGLQVWEQLKGS